MRVLILAALAAIVCVISHAESASAQSAPFCVVNGGGSSCFYYDRQSCERAAGESGACVVNQTAMNSGNASPQRIQPASPWTAFNQGMQAGRERREQNQRETVQSYRSEPDPRWADFCERMQSTDFQLLEAMQGRMSVDEYAQATRAVVNRATYCRSIAQ